MPTQIRLGGCPGWSESSLGAQPHCWFCHEAAQVLSGNRAFQVIQSVWVKDNWAASWQNQQSECAPSEDSDQPEHPPSLIRVFAVRMKKARILSYPLSAQRRLWSDWADAQADLSLHWAHMPFLWFRHEVAHYWSSEQDTRGKTIDFNHNCRRTAEFPLKLCQ